jgi:hypothetical protein
MGRWALQLVIFSSDNVTLCGIRDEPRCLGEREISHPAQAQDRLLSLCDAGNPVQLCFVYPETGDEANVEHYRSVSLAVCHLTQTDQIDGTTPSALGA